MKSLRKYLSVFCVVALLIFCGVPGVAAEYDGEILWNTYPTTAEVNAIIEAEQPLVDLYQEMVGDFAVVDGNIVYPEEYAGAYIENGKLNINVTNFSVATS